MCDKMYVSAGVPLMWFESHCPKASLRRDCCVVILTKNVPGVGQEGGKIYNMPHNSLGLLSTSWPHGFPGGFSLVVLPLYRGNAVSGGIRCDGEIPRQARDDGEKSGMTREK